MAVQRDHQITKVTRRDLLRTGGAAIAGTGLACGPVGHPGAPPPAAWTAPFRFEEYTLDRLQDGLQRGEWTAQEVAAAYLDRIEALDGRGPALHSIIADNPDAPGIAAAIDRERLEGGPNRPLAGVPILLKDNIDTADRMPTTAGSLALAGSVAAVDADLVRRLREAGAILLGKTNLSEWANFRSMRSSSGWSALGGQCRNPYALNRNPCGSSSGSAVAVAANLAMAAIGTETDGSIVCPAAANGIVGIKPTVGLVSQAGIVPVAHSQDTAGPMARTVRDAARTLAVIASEEQWQGVARETTPLHSALDQALLDPDGLRGARIGVARRFFGFHPHADRVIEAALDVMRDAGAHLVDPAGWPVAPQWNAVEYEVLLYEFKTDIETYLGGRGPEVAVRSLADLIAFNERHHDQEMPFFGQEIFHQAVAKGPLSEERYQVALRTNRQLAREDGIDRIMDSDALDTIVAPTGGPAWTTDLVHGDRASRGSAQPAAAAGYPHITVPAGNVFGLPIGLSFFRARLERADARSARLRLRAAYPSPPPAALPGQGQAPNLIHAPAATSLETVVIDGRPVRVHFHDEQQGPCWRAFRLRPRRRQLRATCRTAPQQWRNNLPGGEGLASTPCRRRRKKPDGPGEIHLAPAVAAATFGHAGHASRTHKQGHADKREPGDETAATEAKEAVRHVWTATPTRHCDHGRDGRHGVNPACPESGTGTGLSGAELDVCRGDWSGSRHSSLTEISPATIDRLGAAWVAQLAGASSRATPVVKDGVLYLTAGMNVLALDAETGATVWRWQPESNNAGMVPSWQGVGLGDGLVFVGITERSGRCVTPRIGRSRLDHISRAWTRRHRRAGHGRADACAR